MHTKLVQIEKSTQWLYGQLLIKVQDVACDLFPQRAIVYEKVLRKNGLPVKYSLQEFSDCDKKKKTKKNVLQSRRCSRVFLTLRIFVSFEYFRVALTD